MASLSNDGDKSRWRVTFDLAGKRHTVRLGKVTKKQGEAVKLRVEALIAGKLSRLPLDQDTAAWVGNVGDDLHARLAAAGLVAERKSETLGAFLADYLKVRAADSRGSTREKLRMAAADVVKFFGADTPLRQIDRQRADAYRVSLLTRSPKLAPATASRMLKWCGQFFSHALRLRLIAETPFHGLSLPVGRADGRRVYVPAADVLTALAGAKHPERLLAALSRFAGLRCPSEPLLLRWAEVDLASGRMLVHAPKTANHPGKETRLVPITPELRPFLEAARAEAPADAVWVVGGTKADGWRAVAERDEGWFRVNIGERMTRVVRRAGLTPWPKPYHNLRASLETDWLDRHPIQVVCGWLGNSPAIALKHYLSIRESDYEKATGIDPARNPARTGADPRGLTGTDAYAPASNTTGFPAESAQVGSSPNTRTLPA